MAGLEVQARFPIDRPLDGDLGNWWVTHTKPNCEKKIAARLLDHGISYYLPLYTRKIKVGYLGRVRETVSPLFRGYLCFALEREKHNILYDTRNLVRVIKVPHQELFVKELNAVLKALVVGGNLSIRPGLVPGKRVLILSGPLEGTEGIIVERRGEKQLGLSVNMFNQTVFLKIDSATELTTL